jgi:hypothetical protein
VIKQVNDYYFNFLILDNLFCPGNKKLWKSSSTNDLRIKYINGATFIYEERIVKMACNAGDRNFSLSNENFDCVLERLNLPVMPRWIKNLEIFRIL